eukprot:CAMPEP_0198737474 /NCGR_PEP_ID=MMETSP1475-20131203/67885_1 /TAXON_ID= ORGANISM="Unidentified sp., Strain CCMP1999" /NCGR_SAMPLE_ID=MMETSP1475 /ASSEMBLY_ACC=CAM_ASM_001111 /LENGTH=100 /DNA_ID=CAMNT_0044501339 /DNA_START=1939 /DNA_END=2244 /DNA_ORIENTATION=+
MALSRSSLPITSSCSLSKTSQVCIQPSKRTMLSSRASDATPVVSICAQSTSSAVLITSFCKRWLSMTGGGASDMVLTLRHSSTLIGSSHVQTTALAEDRS